ncbi:MAG: hypothetical protein RLZZ234_444, partial [Candidatus Parcubacteria bacterium]
MRKEVCLLSSPAHRHTIPTMKNTLFLGGVLMFLMWATPTSAAVIYQNDFSAQPTLFTDDTNAYHWNEASGTLSMRLVQ